MPRIQVSIIRFVDAHQPGFVEAEFADADGTNHTLVDKVPVGVRALHGEYLILRYEKDVRNIPATLLIDMTTLRRKIKGFAAGEANSKSGGRSRLPEKLPLRAERAERQQDSTGEVFSMELQDVTQKAKRMPNQIRYPATCGTWSIVGRDQTEHDTRNVGPPPAAGFAHNLKWKNSAVLAVRGS
jgi:hypothetical protein